MPGRLAAFGRLFTNSASLKFSKGDPIMMKKLCSAFLVAPLMLATVAPLAAQQYQHRRHDNFYNGAYEGGRGGQYDRDQYHHHNYRDDQYRDDQYRGDQYRDERHGGIGPGKGALIGGAGGAVLGALLGGGMRGALIGGAAGAGIGAIAGQAHKDNRRHDRYGRPY